MAADENQKIGGDIKMQKNPAFLAERKQIFDELIAEQNNKYKGKSLMTMEKAQLSLVTIENIF